VKVGRNVGAVGVDVGTYVGLVGVRDGFVVGGYVGEILGLSVVLADTPQI
jgi:hypothetical protein